MGRNFFYFMNVLGKWRDFFYCQKKLYSVMHTVYYSINFNTNKIAVIFELKVPTGKLYIILIYDTSMLVDGNFECKVCNGV
jgi:hypothetical protein